jgi:hypothetical protein
MILPFLSPAVLANERGQKVTSSILRTCQKCGKYRPKEEHHVLPQCHFARDKSVPKELRKLVVILCDECHDAIEKFLEILEGNPRGRKVRNRLTAETYIHNTEEWLGRTLSLPVLDSNGKKKVRKERAPRHAIVGAGAH